MGERAELHHGLDRVDEIREGAILDRAVDVLDAHGIAGDAIDGVEDDEAGAVGDEIRLGPALRAEAQPTLGGAGDLRAVAEGLRRVLAKRVIGDAEGLAVLADRQVRDLRAVGGPVAVADDEGDGAQQLAAAEPDVAKVPRLQLDAEGAGAKQSRRLHRLLGSVETHGKRRCARHSSAPPKDILTSPALYIAGFAAKVAVAFGSVKPIGGWGLGVGDWVLGIGVRVAD